LKFYVVLTVQRKKYPKGCKKLKIFVNYATFEYFLRYGEVGGVVITLSIRL